MSKCRFEIDGKCTKWRHKSKCKPSQTDYCDEPLTIVEPDRMCEEASIFGNYYFYITEEQIEALRNGKALYSRDEYGTFIAFKKEGEKE